MEIIAVWFFFVGKSGAINFNFSCLQ